MSSAPVLTPAAEGDAAAVLHALALRDEADTGDAAFSRAELTDGWLAASFAPDRDSVLVWQDGVVAGYAAVFPHGVLAFVTPGYERRGIGTALLGFAERRDRERGETTFRQRTAEGNARAAAHLHAAGYQQARTVWQLTHPLTSLPEAAAPPTGIRLRAVDPVGDARRLHAADARAFAANSDYRPETLEDFAAEHLATPTLDPEASRVAERAAGGGAVAGYLIADIRPGDVGHVDLLAVAPEEREQGLGWALLVRALHVFARAGRRAGALEVASDNPRALALYERAGMTRRLGAAIWEKPAR